MVINRQIRRILFATDFLASSNVALDYAIAFAQHFKAIIVMVHAVELPYPAREAETESSRPSVSRKLICEHLDSLANRVRCTGLSAETSVQEGVQLRRVIDVYVLPKAEALNAVGKQVNQAVKGVATANGMRVLIHGAVESMDRSFQRFGLGIVLAVVLVYFILMAQFTSFIDPFIILMAVPRGIAGVLVLLVITGSTLNVMSLMGVIMMVGIVVSNSILIVEFAGILLGRGSSYRESVVQSCKIRLRPILMTSLATLLGMIPLALGLEAGSEQYAPLARAIIGGLSVSVVVTVFLVPAAYMMVYGRRDERPQQSQQERAPNAEPA
jgi:multidrug efflux pump subunit AcrB